MGTRDHAGHLREETELLRVLVATLLAEVDALVPDRDDGRRTRVDVLARMITTTAADLHQRGRPDETSPADVTNVVQLPRDHATQASTHPVFGPAGRGP